MNSVYDACLCTLCLLAVLYPGADLQCWDTAGNRAGFWSETSCDGYGYSGTWSGYVTSDCRFFGTNEWASVAGEINPSTKNLTATGTSQKGCGSITMTGTFTSDFESISGSYNYSKGGGGFFNGCIRQRILGANRRLAGRLGDPFLHQLPCAALLPRLLEFTGDFNKQRFDRTILYIDRQGVDDKGVAAKGRNAEAQFLQHLEMGANGHGVHRKKCNGLGGEQALLLYSMGPYGTHEFFKKDALMRCPRLSRKAFIRAETWNE